MKLVRKTQNYVRYSGLLFMMRQRRASMEQISIREYSSVSRLSEFVNREVKHYGTQK